MWSSQISSSHRRGRQLLYKGLGRAVPKPLWLKPRQSRSRIIYFHWWLWHRWHQWFRYPWLLWWTPELLSIKARSTAVLSLKWCVREDQEHQHGKRNQLHQPLWPSLLKSPLLASTFNRAALRFDCIVPSTKKNGSFFLTCITWSVAQTPMFISHIICRDHIKKPCPRSLQRLQLPQLSRDYDFPQALWSGSYSIN